MSHHFPLTVVVSIHNSMYIYGFLSADYHKTNLYFFVVAGFTAEVFLILFDIAMLCSRLNIAENRTLLFFNN